MSWLLNTASIKNCDLNSKLFNYIKNKGTKYSVHVTS